MFLPIALFALGLSAPPGGLVVSVDPEGDPIVLDYGESVELPISVSDGDGGPITLSFKFDDDTEWQHLPASDRPHIVPGAILGHMADGADHTLHLMASDGTQSSAPVSLGWLARWIRRRRAARAALRALRIAQARSRFMMARRGLISTFRQMGERVEKLKRKHERLQREKRERERLEREKRERTAREKREREKREREKRERERIERERIQSEQAKREQANRERLRRERLQRERAQRERIQRERAERERIQRERKQREGAQRERAERDRAQRDRAQRERIERERVERERVERERAEKDRAQREKLTPTPIADPGPPPEIPEPGRPDRNGLYPPPQFGWPPPVPDSEDGDIGVPLSLESLVGEAVAVSYCFDDSGVWSPAAWYPRGKVEVAVRAADFADHSAPGEHSIAFRIAENDGFVGETEIAYEVNAPPAIAPVGEALVAPKAGEPVALPVAVTDADGDDVGLWYRFDGQGEWSFLPDAAEALPADEFAARGRGYVEVAAWDGLDHSDDQIRVEYRVEDDDEEAAAEEDGEVDVEEGDRGLSSAAVTGIAAGGVAIIALAIAGIVGAAKWRNGKGEKAPESSSTGLIESE